MRWESNTVNGEEMYSTYLRKDVFTINPITECSYGEILVILLVTLGVLMVYSVHTVLVRCFQGLEIDINLVGCFPFLDIRFGFVLLIKYFIF